MKRTLLLLPLLALALFAAGCATPSFRVYDAADRPVEGALVFWNESWGSGCCLDGCLFYGPIHFSQRAVFTDETGIARLPPRENLRAHRSNLVVLAPDLSRFHIVDNGETILPPIESFAVVDLSVKAEYARGIFIPNWMTELDHAADGKGPFIFFDDPDQRIRGSETLSRWRQLRAAAMNAPATQSPAEEKHAESAETAEAGGGSGEAQPPPVESRAESAEAAE